jgi:hypothetical protein
MIGIADTRNNKGLGIVVFKKKGMADSFIRNAQRPVMCKKVMSSKKKELCNTRLKISKREL